MPRSKKTEQIIQRYKSQIDAGKRITQIALAKEFDVSEARISAVLSQARRRGILPRRQSDEEEVSFRLFFPKSLAAELSEEAKRRGFPHRTSLIRQLIKTVVEDDLFNAVLGDE